MKNDFIFKRFVEFIQNFIFLFTINIFFHYIFQIFSDTTLQFEVDIFIPHVSIDDPNSFSNIYFKFFYDK